MTGTKRDAMVEVTDGHPDISRDAPLQATALMWQAQDVYTDAMADAYRRLAVQMAIDDEQLYCHPNTVRYRLHRIEERTGRSLSVPVELAELCLAFEIRWNPW